MEIPTRWPRTVKTLAIDVGGTGLKASVLDPKGDMMVDRVRVDTPYPCSPELLLEQPAQAGRAAARLPPRVGRLPGLIRRGHVVSVPSLSRVEPGGPRGRRAGRRSGRATPSRTRCVKAFNKPLLLANDADVQGCAVVSGKGFEYVMTLGTGVGTALFNDGLLLPHIELSHGPFRHGAVLRHPARRRRAQEHRQQALEHPGPQGALRDHRRPLPRPHLHRWRQRQAPRLRPGRQRRDRLQHRRHPRRHQALGAAREHPARHAQLLTP